MSLDRGKGVSETASTAFDRNLVEWLPRFTKIKLRCDGGMAKDSVQLFALVGGRNHQSLSIFGHGSPRNIDILFSEQCCNFIVRQGFPSVLVCNQVFY